MDVSKLDNRGFTGITLRIVRRDQGKSQLREELAIVSNPSCTPSDRPAISPGLAELAETTRYLCPMYAL